jgi:hypothetical protein
MHGHDEALVVVTTFVAHLTYVAARVYGVKSKCPCFCCEYKFAEARDGTLTIRLASSPTRLREIEHAWDWCCALGGFNKQCCRLGIGTGLDNFDSRTD